MAFPSFLLALLLVVSLVRLASFDVQLRSHAAGGDYGTPLAVTLQAVKALGGGAGANGAGRVFVESDSGDTQAVYQYLADAGYAPRAAFVDPQLALVFPASRAASYLFTSTDGPAYRTVVSLADGTEGSDGLRLPATGAPAYTVVSLDEQALRNLPMEMNNARPLGPFTIGGGLTMTASTPAVYRAGAPLDIALLWQVVDPTPFRAQPVRLFVHLYDANRHTVAQQDALGYPAAAWQRGDRFITWFQLQPSSPLPPGTYTLVTGLYTVQGFHVFPVRGPRGEDLGGEVPLGTLKVGT